MTCRFEQRLLQGAWSAMLLSLGACAPPAAQTNHLRTPIASWLYVWAASADTTRRGAFLVQYDVRRGSSTAGRIANVVYAGAGSRGTHHTEYALQSDGYLFADDFGTGKSYVFDLNDPASPKVRASFTTAGPFGWPHSYVRLPSGNRLVTYQFQSRKFNQPPGGIAEARPDGTIVRFAAAAAGGIDDKEITPYSLEVIPTVDRAVTTSTSMIEDTGVGIQIWRLSDLALLHTIRIPGDRLHASHATDTVPHHLFPGEPRLLPDGKTVMFATFTCGLYTLTGIEGSSPRIAPVYRFRGKDCAVPVTTGKYWIQTVPETQSVVVLDISNPSSPREVSRVDYDGEVRPHWLAIDESGRRLVMNSSGRRDPRLHLLTFDPVTGNLSRDAMMPVLDIASVNVPGLGIVQGVPHGSVFSRR